MTPPKRTHHNPPSQERIVTTIAGNVSLDQTPPSKTRRKPKSAVADDIIRDKVGGFRDFLQDYAVVGLALGFVVGQQANGVVKQFVDSFLNPLFSFIFGENLSSREFFVHHEHQAIAVPWGAFVYTLLEFFFVLIGIYIAIKFFRLERFAKKKDKK